MLQLSEKYEIDISGYKFVYVGLCDNIKTKWVTKSEWDFKIKLKYNSVINDIEYSDSNGKKILVFESDEDGYYEY